MISRLYRFFPVLPVLLLVLCCPVRSYSALSFNLDSIAAKGRFARFCVGVYRWGDVVFNGIDTCYVRPVGYKWNVKLRSSSWSEFDNFYFSRGHEMMMGTPFCSSIGGDVQFMAVSLGYDININKLFGGQDRSKSKFNFEFSSGLFFARFYSIVNADGMDIIRYGDMNNVKLPYKSVHTTVWGLDATYVFNPRRYSNSAAFSFGKIQVRSQGSWLAGLAFQSQKLDFDFSGLPAEVGEWMPERWRGGRYQADGFSIGFSGGYGFNWVPRRNWTVGVQGLLAPSLYYGYLNGMRKEYGFKMNYRINLGAVWNHKRWFAGVTAKFDSSFIYSGSTLIDGLLNIEAKVGWRFNLF